MELFWTKKLWLRGGIIGVLICVVLFFFYVSVLLPNIDRSALPQWILVLTLATGHLFVIFSGFIIPYGFLCKFTVPTCSNWSAYPQPGSVPWKLDTGELGYCTLQTMAPTDACARLSEMVGFWGLAILLLTVYFAIGALIGYVIQKRKKSKF